MLELQLAGVACGIQKSVQSCSVLNHLIFRQLSIPDSLEFYSCSQQLSHPGHMKNLVEVNGKMLPHPWHGSDATIGCEACDVSSDHTLVCRTSCWPDYYWEG